MAYSTLHTGLKKEHLQQSTNHHGSWKWDQPGMRGKGDRGQGIHTP